ncbi:MAG: oligosaccharide flippase family protein [Candidatus Omnitrophica bacterium]|nr:oligosaccharide flippase family protein [Candidatus Omnitrophota bacterium]
MNNKNDLYLAVRSFLGKKLIHNAFFFTVANTIRSGLPLLLIPFLTRFLSPEGYGIISTYEILVAVCIIFVGMNGTSAISIEFFKKEKEELKVYVGNSIFIASFFFLCMLFLCSIFGVSFAKFINIPAEYIHLILWQSFAFFFVTLNLVLWQVEEKAKPYCLFQITQSIVNVSLTILFVMYLRWAWQGRILAIVFAVSLFSLVSCFFLFKRQYITFRIDWICIKNILAFGIPLIPHMLGAWIMTAIDRLFINEMVGVATTGIYTVGYQIGAILSLLMSSFNQAWSPYLYKNLKKNDPAQLKKIVKFTYCMFGALILVAASIAVLAPYILKYLVGEEFYAANEYVFWITLGSAANGMYYMVAGYIFYAQKSHILAWMTLLSAVFNVILNYIFIKAYGAIGAAQATTIVLFFNFFMVWFFSSRVYNMPWLYFLTKSETKGL